MKCTSKKRTLASLTCMALVSAVFLQGCGSLSYEMAYDADSNVSSFNVISKEDTRTAAPYAANLCVVMGDVTEGTSADLSGVTAALLCDLNDHEAICAKNAHGTLAPASITKVMTALVALRYSDRNQVLTASSAVTIQESGVTLCGLKPGDTMTLDQALRILLVYSANDVALLIAENVGGSVEGFVELMNQEAHRLGATNTHFTNPHGLTDANHFTTAYDLYLIFNEAIQNETFSEIIQMTSYQTVYYDKQNKEKKFDKSTSNGYLKGSCTAPAGVTVIGGKTGTTKAAGNCIILLVRDVSGAPYVAVVMGALTSDALYDTMNSLLKEVSGPAGQPSS